ncbi:MAG: hypothetical protein COA97_02845 [Flavobacteriales bacterium]|nr:MAG: hypothetical protein COA97_02845 [Flavobacteriales bacterium]
MGTEDKILDYKEFINKVLIDGVDKMIAQGFEYYAFVIICQGIEVLGSFYDSEEIDKYGESKTRFKAGLKNLFKNSFYKQNQDFLFKQLRGNMIHKLRPGKEIILTSHNISKTPLEYHLKKDEEGRRILVIEQFFEDFKGACAKLLTKIELDKDNLDKDKQDVNYLNIFEKNIDNQNVILSGDTEYHTSEKLEDEE